MTWRIEEDGYTIEVDVARRLVTLELIGFWTVDTANAFVCDQQRAVARVTGRPRQHLVLADLNRFTLQTQEVVGICRALIADARLPARRLAVVAGDGLSRIQIKRIMVRDGMEAFADRAGAMEWLMRPDAAAA